MFKVLVQVVMKLFLWALFSIQKWSDSQQLSCISHDKTFLLCFPLVHTCRHIYWPYAPFLVCLYKGIYVRHIDRMFLVARSCCVQRLLVQIYVQKDAFGATCIFFMILGNLRIFWNFRKFKWSVHRLSSDGGIPRGYCDCIPCGGLYSCVFLMISRTR